MTTPKKRVLILCTGNSARSQMAEALIRHLLGTEWDVHSAGTQPAPQVHPLAVQVMAEWGIDIAHQRPKSMEPFLHQEFDLVVTVCDDARRACPRWPGMGEVLHFPLPDPSAVQGPLPKRLQAFRAVRNALKETLIPLLREWQSQ